MLASITLRRFKNLTDVTIPLGRVNVLIGTNNSGKSSVLHGIQFAISVAQTAKMLGVTTLSPEQLIYAPLRDVAALAQGGDLRQDIKTAIEVVFTKSSIGDDDSEYLARSIVTIRRGKNKNLSVAIADGGLKTAMESIEHPYAMYVPGLAGIPSTEPYRTPAALRRAAARGDANAVLRNVLWSLKGNEAAWRTFSDNLHSVFPDHRVSVDFNPNEDEFVEAAVESPRGTFPIDSAGTGFLQTVQILAYAAKYRPPLLLLDEPDSHIHPDRQRRLVALLSKLAEAEDFQVVIATHSRHLLDQLNMGAKFHWMSNGERVDEDRPDRVRVLTDLGALDSGDLLKGGDVDSVLLTEDDDHVYIQALLEASGFDMARTQIWSYSGCTKIDAAIILAAFIREHAAGAEVLVHRDSDYLSDQETGELIETFSKKQVKLFLTEGTDVESHFLNATHIVALYAQVSEEQVRLVIEDATKDARDDSVSRLASRLLSAARAARRAAGRSGDPDIVEITDKARAQFDANRARWRFGKKTLGLAVAGLQRLLGENPKLARPTAALSCSVLSSAAEGVARRRSQGSNVSPIYSGTAEPQVGSDGSPFGQDP